MISKIKIGDVVRINCVSGYLLFGCEMYIDQKGIAVRNLYPANEHGLWQVLMTDGVLLPIRADLLQIVE